MKPPESFLAPRKDGVERLYTPDEVLSIVKDAQLDANAYKDRIIVSLFKLREGEMSAAVAVAKSPALVIPPAHEIPAPKKRGVHQPIPDVPGEDDENVVAAVSDSAETELVTDHPKPIKRNNPVVKQAEPPLKVTKGPSVDKVKTAHAETAAAQPRKGGRFVKKEAAAEAPVKPASKSVPLRAKKSAPKAVPPPPKKGAPKPPARLGTEGPVKSAAPKKRIPRA